MNLFEQDLPTLDQILDCVGFLESTFWHTLWLWRETGDVVNHPTGSPGCPHALHFDNINYLIWLVNHCPTWFLDELLNLLKSNRFITTHFTTIHRELVHAGISLKKLRKIAKERDEDKWAEFVRQMSQYSPEEIGFINETSRMRGPQSGRMIMPERACVPREGVFLFGVITSLTLVYSHWMACPPPMSLKAPLLQRSLSISLSMMW